MDPVTALGVSAAVVQLLEVGVRVTKRLTEYIDACPRDAPGPLANIGAKLPLLLNALSRMQDPAQLECYDAELRCILHGAIIGCLKLARETEEIVAKILPGPGETLALKLKKALRSLGIEQRVVEMDQGLQAYIQVLILHKVVDSATVMVEPKETPTYFWVKEKFIDKPTPRNALLSRLDTCFHKTVQAQIQHPEFVVLEGQEGVGKSQLALTYCYKAHIAEHFRTVFWLDATTTESLKLSLEGVAAEVRRSKAGTRTEKLSFCQTFLAKRWHPWLLVLDNYCPTEFAQEPIEGFFPTSGYGAILVTSRSIDPLSSVGTRIRVPQLLTEGEEIECRKLVTNALRRKDLQFVASAVAEGTGLDVNSRSYNPRILSECQPFINVAAEFDFLEAVRFFLDHGARIRADSMVPLGHLPRASSLLSSAVKGRSLAVLTFCLDYDDYKGFYLESEDYYEAFGTAIKNGFDDMAQCLLERRKDHFEPNAHNIEYSFSRAIMDNYVPVLRCLLAYGKFPASAKTRKRILCGAIEYRQTEMVQFLVLEAKVDPDFTDDSEPPLFTAALSRMPHIDERMRHRTMTHLLDAGACPNCTRGDRETVLHFVAEFGYASLVTLLLQYGADATAEDDEEMTPLLLAIERGKSESYPALAAITILDAHARERYYARALTFAARKGERDLVLLLLKNNNVNLGRESPLLAAVQSNQVPMARLLLRRGARQDIEDDNGKTPLLLAAEGGLNLAVKDMANADNSPSLEVFDRKGNTPLMLATRGNHSKTVKTLLDLGASKEAMNDFGETALDIAEEGGFEEITQMLQM